VNLPLWNADATERLLKCDRDVGSVKNSTVPLCTALVMNTLSSFPWHIARLVAKCSPFPSGLSNFPAGFDQMHVNLDGKTYPFIDLYCCPGIPTAKMGTLHIIILDDSVV
jgi:hypothetical protein